MNTKSTLSCLVIYCIIQSYRWVQSSKLMFCLTKFDRSLEIKIYAIPNILCIHMNINLILINSMRLTYIRDQFLNKCVLVRKIKLMHSKLNELWMKLKDGRKFYQKFQKEFLKTSYHSKCGPGKYIWYIWYVL